MGSIQPTEQRPSSTNLTFTTSDSLVRVHQAHVYIPYQDKCPRVINGGLAVELQLKIYRSLSANDILNISTTCRHARIVIDHNAEYLAKPLIEYHEERLRQDANFLNFEGLSFVTAWRRFSGIFDINSEVYGDVDEGPLSSLFVFNYAEANPAPRAPTMDDYFDSMETILGISEWCRWFKDGTHDNEMTWPARTLSDGRWKWALEEAFAPFADKIQYMPGRYSGLVLVFRDEAPGFEDPSFIIQAFEELRADPLKDPPGKYLGDFIAVDFDLQESLTSGLGVEPYMHGLCPIFADRHVRAEGLMLKILWERKGRSDLVYAALLSGLEIKWEIESEIE